MISCTVLYANENVKLTDTIDENVLQSITNNMDATSSEERFAERFKSTSISMTRLMDFARSADAHEICLLTPAKIMI